MLFLIIFDIIQKFKHGNKTNSEKVFRKTFINLRLNVKQRI